MGVEFFFFNDTATTEIYTLSLHDALPISASWSTGVRTSCSATRKRPATWPEDASSPSCGRATSARAARTGDRKSTRLNSSHANISYAVFCLKKTKMESCDLLWHADPCRLV